MAWTGAVPGTPPDDLHRILSGIHCPESIEVAHACRQELASDEVLEIQVALLTRRQRRALSTVRTGIPINPHVRDQVISPLPFSPTGAQVRCMDEIRADLQSDGPAMNRLLQGEVGSGKTLVALAAAVDVASAGGQTAFLAPTEVLSEQHFETLAGLLHARAGIPVRRGCPRSDAAGVGPALYDGAAHRQHQGGQPQGDIGPRSAGQSGAPHRYPRHHPARR